MPNPMGAPESQEAEDALSVALQSAATANGNGSPAAVSGYSGAQTFELNNQGSGSCTVNLEGSNDGGTTWYAVGYSQVDNVSSPVRAVSAISVTASPFAHVYNILDSYALIRARISATAGALSLTANLRANPV
jgi:hypothetical protein